MVEDRRREATMKVIGEKIKTFSRIEKAFYGSIALTSLLLAIGIIFLQTRLLQIHSQMTTINQEINKKKTEINDSRQAANELMREARLIEIAEKYELIFNNDNIGVAE